MILVNLLKLVVLSQAFTASETYPSARVLKPKAPHVPEKGVFIQNFFQNWFECNYEEEYLRGLKEGKEKVLKEMKKMIECNDIYYDDGIYFRGFLCDGEETFDMQNYEDNVPGQI